MTKANWQKRAKIRTRLILKELIDVVPQKKLKLVLKSALKDKNLGVGVLIVSAKDSQLLNLQYRNKDYPTDVLSFAVDKKSVSFLAKDTREVIKNYLGDLVICLPVLKRQALKHGVNEKQELDLLLIHGLLHLLGFDHEKSKAQEQAMLKIETKVLERLGYRGEIGLISHSIH